MGLDTTHGCWHGPYTAFARWRHALARAAGYAVWDVKHEDGICRPTLMIDWGHIATEERLMGKWDEAPADPLLVLLVHHDHAGEIRPEHMEPLAMRIEQLMDVLDPNDAIKASRFVDGLRSALEAGEPVIFH